ncbi:MAG: TlyA family rRNA (cytidine-2'-O)-methyltransferase [Hyphomonas sp.]|uniref:TlyA family RNA methyltransferase n=1 Tax=Hyphomonas sp. TaxID=87 RepID=UPI001D1B9056|nr:TlyA family RNA methyltransferase [Hyphomonas sp.]MBA4226677.1 TlyA family rRNA (cytidine-2'-O)-methyltransferase [Hyphomonas sp.]
MTDAPPPERDRADKMLVALGHFESRAGAQAAIAAGRVKADGQLIRKPSDMIARSARIEAEAAHPYVSRGGLKLAHALETFGIDVTGKTCLDLGASTGGFTDVLLQRGAAHVTAIDVGHGQLHPKIAADTRVSAFEGLNARDLTPAHLKAAPEIIVCDLSFVSLHKVLPVPLTLAAPGARLIALFKPQFEVGPENVGKGGIVTDEEAVREALARFPVFLSENGWRAEAPIPSPIEGGDGNREYLFLARRPQI